jgi:hypothetical protein
VIALLINNHVHNKFLIIELFEFVFSVNQSWVTLTRYIYIYLLGLHEIKFIKVISDRSIGIFFKI